MSMAALQYLDFDASDDEQGIGCFDAMASVLPAPKARKPQTGSRRTRAIADGAATIAADGRDSCLQLPR